MINYGDLVDHSYPALLELEAGYHYLYFTWEGSSYLRVYEADTFSL